jgi:hypothetical protein
MITLEKKLKKIDVYLKSKILNGLDSIYKIDRKDSSFISFVSEFKDLEKTSYIVYSNDNSSRYIYFLNKNGKTITKKDDFCVNSLLYVDLDFDIGYNVDYSNNIILKEYMECSIELPI